MGHFVKQIPTKELLFVLIDVNVRTGKRMVGCIDGRVLGAYGRDELLNNGKRLPSLASDNKLALTNMFCSAHKGGVSHTFNELNILTRQAHRPRVYDVMVHPQPPSPAKTDSDHNIAYAMVRLGGRIAPNRRIRTKNKSSPSTGRSFDLTEIADSE